MPLNFKSEIFKSGIGRRLVLYMVLFSSLVTLLSTATQLIWDYKRDVDLIKGQLQLIEDVHLGSLTISMWVTDKPQLQAHMDGISLLRDMQFLELRDHSKAWVTVGTRQSENILSRQYPLIYNHNGRVINIGSLTVQSSLTNVYQRLVDKVWVILVSNGIKTFLVAGFMLFLVYMINTRHLVKISSFIRTLDVEQPGEPLRLDRKNGGRRKQDELDLVVNAFNEMQAKSEQSFVALRESEERYSVMARVAPVGIFRTDAHGDNIYVNKHWCELAGMTPEEAFGDGWGQAIHPDDRDRVFNEWYEAATEDISYKSDFRFQRPDGKITWLYCMAEAERSDDGKVLGYVGALIDVSEHKKTEAVWQSLAASTSALQFEDFLDDALTRLIDVYDCQYALVGRLLPDGKRVQTLAILDKGMRIDNFEYDLQGTPCQDLLENGVEFLPKYASTIYSTDKTLVGMGVESFLGATLVDSNGVAVGVLVVMDTRPMHLDQWTEPVIGVFAQRLSLELERDHVNQQLRNHRQHLEELVQERTRHMQLARDEAERANAAKSDFLSRMSHELRTPMNAILGFGQILQMDADTLNEDQRINVQEILDAGHHLLGLINEVLDLSRIEAGKLEVYMQPVLVDEQLKHCIAMIQPQVDSCQLKIIDNISGKGQTVQADVSRFKQVLLNLLSNAVKYNCSQGSIILTCEVIDNKQLRINITDTGAGLTEAEISRLFRPFERMESASDIEGTGIGLVISKHLVELMGGTIGVSSIHGEGCTFWLQLNMVQALSDQV